MNLDPVQRAAQEQFSRQSDRYGRGHILEQTDDVREAMRHVGIPAEADVLDVATGGGHTALYLAGLGHRVTASDVSAAMLERTTELARQRGLSLTPREHAAEKLPYADEEFDLVSCRVAAHHFSSPAAFISESARVLRTGGYFLLIDGSVADGQSEAEEWLHAIEKLRDPSHHRFLTPGQWRALCENSGLEVKEASLSPFKQPDLNWYFETASTSAANRERVLQLVEDAPPSVRTLFGLAREEGKIIWWWQRLTLVAQKPQ